MITENYIKMCEQAEEIQKVYNPEAHNHVWNGSICTYIPLDSYKYDKYTEYGHQYIYIADGYLMNCIWLPTQEQLQEITFYQNNNDIPAMKRSMYLQLEVFTNWALKQQYLYNTMNELWLAFVMKEKHSKAWNGEEWILNS